MLTAETGSGKTLAFLLPHLARLFRTGSNTRGKSSGFSPSKEGQQRDVPNGEWTGPQLLLLAPTAELCTQVAAAVVSVAPQLEPVVISSADSAKSGSAHFPGGSKWPSPILVGTPTGLLGSLRRLSSQSGERHPLRHCTAVVVDEADLVLQQPQARRSLEQLLALCGREELPAAAKRVSSDERVDGGSAGDGTIRRPREPLAARNRAPTV